MIYAQMTSFLFSICKCINEYLFILMLCDLYAHFLKIHVYPVKKKTSCAYKKSQLWYDRYNFDQEQYGKIFLGPVETLFIEHLSSCSFSESQQWYDCYNFDIAQCGQIFCAQSRDCPRKLSKLRYIEFVAVIPLLQYAELGQNIRSVGNASIAGLRRENRSLYYYCAQR